MYTVNSNYFNNMKTIKIILTSLTIILIGIIFYLFISYYGLTKVKLSKEYTVQITRKLKGVVVKGISINELPLECSKQFFLINGNRRTWLIPSFNDRKSWPDLFSVHEFSKVEVEGYKDFGYSPCKYGAGANCGCTSYLIVSKFINIEK